MGSDRRLGGWEVRSRQSWGGLVPAGTLRTGASFQPSLLRPGAREQEWWVGCQPSAFLSLRLELRIKTLCALPSSSFQHRAPRRFAHLPARCSEGGEGPNWCGALKPWLQPGSSMAEITVHHAQVRIHPPSSSHSCGC